MLAKVFTKGATRAAEAAGQPGAESALLAKLMEALQGAKSWAGQQPGKLMDGLAPEGSATRNLGDMLRSLMSGEMFKEAPYEINPGPKVSGGPGLRNVWNQYKDWINNPSGTPFGEQRMPSIPGRETQWPPATNTPAGPAHDIANWLQIDGHSNTPLQPHNIEELIQTFRNNSQIASDLALTPTGGFDIWKDLGMKQGSYSRLNTQIPTPGQMAAGLYEMLADRLARAGQAVLDAPGKMLRESSGQTGPFINSLGSGLADMVQAGTQKGRDAGLPDNPRWFKGPDASSYLQAKGRGSEIPWQADLLKTYYRGIKPTLEKAEPVTDFLSPFAKDLSPAALGYLLYNAFSGSDEEPPVTESGVPTMTGQGGVPGVMDRIGQMKTAKGIR